MGPEVVMPRRRRTKQAPNSPATQASNGVEKLTLILGRGDECRTLELQLSPVPLDAAAFPGWFLARTATRWVAGRIL